MLTQPEGEESTDGMKLGMRLGKRLGIRCSDGELVGGIEGLGESLGL